MGRKSSFTEEQIIRAMKEVDAGAQASDVCRRLGVTEQTCYVTVRPWIPAADLGLERSCGRSKSEA